MHTLFGSGFVVFEELGVKKGYFLVYWPQLQTLSGGPSACDRRTSHVFPCQTPPTPFDANAQLHILSNASKFLADRLLMHQGQDHNPYGRCQGSPHSNKLKLEMRLWPQHACPTVK